MTEQQEKFLNALFGEAQGNFREAMNIARSVEARKSGSADSDLSSLSMPPPAAAAAAAAAVVVAAAAVAAAAAADKWIA